MHKIAHNTRYIYIGSIAYEFESLRRRTYGIQTMFYGAIGLTPKRLSRRPTPHHLGPCRPELGLA